ncbi:DUF4625 domain-containing protein [Carboxylicivirga sp. N1Y90]|uniref:DUF4625 domain-containing protein n=1 Tax=Carboxylicivirga fragile TaxID=3417571 RepID=UPI003D346576|nr:DUF4625 domain-containing protein [Marinilabiliaceae bacterium N1Y90]
MNKFFKIIFPIAIILLGLTVSCGGSDDPAPTPPDTEKPTVTFTKPNASGSTSYTKGAALDIDATFADNDGLAECKITITYNEATPSAGLKGITDPWKKATNGSDPGEHVVTFNGEKSKKVEISQLFNENIETECKGGSYTLTFDFKDKSGNEAIEKVDVTIEG